MAHEWRTDDSPEAAAEQATIALENAKAVARLRLDVDLLDQRVTACATALAAIRTAG